MREMTDVPACPDGVPVRELPDDCREFAATPADLFAKLDDWGVDSLVIPHGTTWGLYTPLGSAWDKQLVGSMHDPERQALIEVFSGHGNSEEFRAWREVVIDADGKQELPGPVATTTCRRAGGPARSSRARCAAAGEADATSARSARSRRARTTSTADTAGHLTVPGATPDDWLDSGQCRDCFQPAFNYRPKSSVQYIMALARLRRPGAPAALRASASWRRATTTPRGPAPATRSSRART